MHSKPEAQAPLLPFAEIQATSSAPPEPALLAQDSDDTAKLLKLFKINGNSIDLSDNRLKAKSRTDYVRRLTYLLSVRA